MANRKISELVALTSPDGTEELIVNDGGVSKKIAMSNLMVGIDDNATTTKLIVSDDGITLQSNSPEGGQLNYTDVADSIVFSTDVDANGNFRLFTTNTTHRDIQIGHKATNTGSIHLITNNSEKLSVSASGHVTVNSGNLVIGTAGKGIDFAAATPDGTGSTGSEVLDDYEEGTFTPTVVGITTAGVATYIFRSARYTKIGHIVTFELDVGWSAHTGSGILAINGLPFTTGGSRKIFTIGRMIGLATPELGMRSWSESGSTQVRFSTTDTAGVEDNVALDASVMMLYVSGTYQVA